MRPNPKTIPKPNLNPNSGAIFLGRNCLTVPPSTKANPDLDLNNNPNRGAIFLGGNCPDTEFSDFSPSEKVQFTFCTKLLLRFV